MEGKELEEVDLNDAGDCISPREGYLAMYYFVDAYCRRGVGPDQLTLLWSDMFPTAENGADAIQTADPALWSDWVEAVATAKEGGLPPR